MEFNYKYHLDGNFHPDSKVWVYQSSRLFKDDEAQSIDQLLQQFTIQWKSHGVPVKGAAYLFFNQFVVLLADETATGVSGCSTDSSVHLIKVIEEQFVVNMFDRTTLAFVIEDSVQLLPLSQLQQAFDNGMISMDTLYFNNLVQTKEELENKWIIPIKSSWLSGRLKMKVQG
jgi:hypothetical protein